jgi:general secretion pathway protein D
MTHETRRLLPATALVILLALTVAGCATSAALRAGQRAEALQDFDRAVVEYTKVLRQKPDNRDARQGLERTKVRSALEHLTRGRRYENSARLDEALVEYQLAAELNPSSGDIDDALRNLRNQLRAKIAVAREDKTALESVIERSRTMAPLGLDLPRDIRMPGSVTFRDASSRDIYSALAKFANVNIVFDPQFREQPLTVDLRGATLEEALASVSSATRNFYRVTAQRTVTVIPDTPAKRREYEEEILRVFYLSNADLKETSDLLRIVIDARRVSTVAATNAIAIKDTPERIAAAGRIIDAIDKARPEVVIDVELLEVDRTRLREYGLQIASPGSPGIDGAANLESSITLRDLRNLSQSGIFLTNLPGLVYRLLKTDGTTRTLANPQLRTSEGMPAQARFGEKVPVPVTQFAPIATGGINQQPITSYQYQNIGVNIDITPRTHHDSSVSLALKLEVSSISGTGFGDLPTFGNREINTVIRLKDGETNMLAGLIRDDERRSMSGIPGFSDVPILGRLFAHTRRESQETDIVLTLTPRIIRVLDLKEDDLRPFRVGRDGDSGGGVIELPIPAVIPPRDPAQDAPPAQPQQPPGPVLSPTPFPPPGAK